MRCLRQKLSVRNEPTGALGQLSILARWWPKLSDSRLGVGVLVNATVGYGPLGQQGAEWPGNCIR